MPRIAIELPSVEADDKVEVELTVNGEKRRLVYRIEIFAWDEHAEPEEPRANCLKRILEEHGEGWQVVSIGEASEREVSVLLKQVASRREEAPCSETT